MFSITGQVSTRLALGVCFALFASGCGGGRSPVPTAPSNPVISGPPVLTGPYSVTSVVADENGGRSRRQASMPVVWVVLPIATSSVALI